MPPEFIKAAITVSIHASAREATVNGSFFVPLGSGFNPRLRTGGDLCLALRVICPPVSIHASAREATKAKGKEASRLRVSIHASAREATRYRLPSVQRAPEFQSTPPHGRRLILGGIKPLFAGFQSTPPHGRRLGVLLVMCFAPKFQSTPPHGRRPGRRQLQGPRQSGFNPRLRTGGDHSAAGQKLPHGLFQSTPPHGRRL